jgi:hypothetical protein
MKLRKNQQPQMFNFMSSPSSGVSCFAPNVESLSCAWLVPRMVLKCFGQVSCSQVGWLVPPVQLNTSLLFGADSIVPVQCEPKPAEPKS